MSCFARVRPASFHSLCIKVSPVLIRSVLCWFDLVNISSLALAGLVKILRKRGNQSVYISFLRTVHEKNSNLNFKALDSCHLTCVFHVFQVRISKVFYVHTEK